jgi:hypothetical protein
MEFVVSALEEKLAKAAADGSGLAAPGSTIPRRLR